MKIDAIRWKLLNQIGFMCLDAQRCINANKKYDFFKFQIDNNDPWIDDSPEYDNGWLMSNISNYTEQAASEIEKEMRAGRKFYHLDKNDTIAWFSLIGSNKAFDAFDKCVLKNGLY